MLLLYSMCLVEFRFIHALYKVYVVFAIICNGLLLVLFAIKLMNVVVGIMGIILDWTKENHLTIHANMFVTYQINNKLTY